MRAKRITADDTKVKVRKDIDPAKIMEEVADAYVAFIKKLPTGVPHPSVDHVLGAATHLVEAKYNVMGFLL
mgnify:CR=1 FL=1